MADCPHDGCDQWFTLDWCNIGDKLLCPKCGRWLEVDGDYTDSDYGWSFWLIEAEPPCPPAGER